MELYGLFHSFLFRDEKNGKSIFLITYQLEDGSRKNIAVSGMVPEFVKKTPLVISGKLVDTDSYGKQIKMESFSFCSRNVFDSVEFVENVLEKKNSHTIAREFVNITGMDVFKTYDLKDYEKSDYYNEFKFIISKIEGMMLLREWISTYHTPITFFDKLLKKYGVKKAKELFPDKIYQVGIKWELSLEECDEVAKKNGGKSYDKDRIIAAHRVVLRYFESKGHTYIPMEQFYLALKRRMKNFVFKEELPCSYLYYAKPSFVQVEKKDEEYIVFDKGLFFAEKSIVRNLVRLSKRTPEPYSDKYLINIQNNNQVTVGDDQRNAIETLLKERGIGILYGGPGSGKTTTIDLILQIYKTMHPDHQIKLCAPTGRAAQRMEESTNFPSSTIHKLIELRPFQDDEIHKSKEDPIEANLVIMDETSMTDTRICAMFLEAIPPDCSLIFVGDPDQLESVGPGRILYDFIHSGKGLFKICELRQLFRQAENSNIIQNARKIKDGDTSLATGEDFQIFQTISQQQTLEFVQTYSTYYTSEEIQFLCPIKKELTGVVNTNKVLQSAFNHSTKDRIQYGNRRFFLNDKVILTQNRSELNYYNGDIGYIKEIHSGSVLIQCENRMIKVPKEHIADMDLAYDITIHKSQGSEFPFVFIIIPASAKYFLTRNLLYTAITRAKKKVILLIEQPEGEENLLNYAITKLPIKRKTRLAGLLEEQCETLS